MGFAHSNISNSWFIKNIKKEMRQVENKGGNSNNASTHYESSPFLADAPNFNIFVLGKSKQDIKKQYIDFLKNISPDEVEYLNTSEALFQFESNKLVKGYKYLKISLHQYRKFYSVPKNQLHIPTAYYIFNTDKCVGYLIMDTQWFNEESNLIKEIKSMDKNVEGLKSRLIIPSDKSIDFYSFTQKEKKNYKEFFSFMNINKPQRLFENKSLSSSVMVLQAYYPQEVHNSVIPLITDKLNQHLDRYASWL